MRTKLLLTTAALVAGMSLASAQHMPTEVQQGQTPQPGAQQIQAAGSVTLTNEQRVAVRQKVLAKPDIPRTDPNMIDFAIVVGTTVPPYFRAAEVPEALVQIRPEWRGHMYLVAGDDIVVMDRSRRIVATLPGDSTTGQRTPLPNAAGSSSMPQEK